MSGRWPVTCSTCGKSRERVAETAPCPSCGATGETVNVSAADGVTATGSLSVTAEYAKERPWQEKFEELQQRVTVIERIYSGDLAGVDLSEWRNAANAAFQSVHEMLDAVAADALITPDVSYALRRAFNADAWLKLAADANNTRKHAGRDPNKCHARIGEIVWGDRPPALTVTRECPGQDPERFDAREAVIRALEAWRAILQLHGLLP